MTFFHSILISKWRCFLRFDEVKAIHFPAQRGPFSRLPFVLTLGDNHIGDLSLARLRLCPSPSNTAAGLAWTARESTPFNTSTETERNRESESIQSKASTERKGRARVCWLIPQLTDKGFGCNNTYNASAFVTCTSAMTYWFPGW